MATASIFKKHSVKQQFMKYDLKDNHTIVFFAQKGIDPKIFYLFADAIKMAEKDLAKLINLSPKTVTNYYKQQRNVNPSQSEHLLKLIVLFEKGEEVFGSVDEFNYWLKKCFWNSTGMPLDWITTHGGVDLVINELDRLAEGILYND